ncbi:MAG: glycerol-3-phosphate 1-O-acyltransferase PlsY [Pseudomonadota bacterium]
MMPELTTTLPLLATVALVAYLLGSVPFGIVVARAFGLGDLRQIGSGNIGATNVLRTGSKLGAALTLLGDAGKGGFAVLIARAMAGEDAAQLAAFAAFLGHCYPIYLRFQGGKGVATFLGTLLALAPLIGVACCLSWLTVAALTRMSSAAALGAAIAAPAVASWLLPEMTALCLALAALVWLRHKGNIARIASGTEPKIGKK